jgi:hypothetical protein
MECFRAQDYPNKELIESSGIGLCGTIRNRLCERANGDMIAFFDDDDWQSPHRLTRQVSELLGGAEVCGTSKHWLHDLRNGASNLVDKHEPRGPTLAFWRRAWQNCPFPDVALSESIPFLRAYRGRTVDIADPSLIVCFLHDDNTQTYSKTRDHPWAKEQIQALMGETFHRYALSA